MDMQTAIVFVIVASAVGVTLVKLKKILRGEGGCSCGCSSCSKKSACVSKEQK